MITCYICYITVVNDTAAISNNRFKNEKTIDIIYVHTVCSARSGNILNHSKKLRFNNEFPFFSLLCFQPIAIQTLFQIDKRYSA